MLNAKITALSSYVPQDVLTNDDLSKLVDTNDEWITTRVGIKERHILKGDKHGSSVLGIKAVEKLLAESGTKPEDVEMLICATSTPDYRFPSTASVIIHQTGLTNCYGFDVEAACAGFVMCLQMANGYIKSGLYKKVIICATEEMSSMTDYTDRATCPLFGDGAACALVEPTDDTSVGVIDMVGHVNGEGLQHLVMKAGGSVKPASHETVDAHEHFIYQEGRQVYRHAVTDMVESSLEILKRNNLTIDQIDFFVPHQANMRIIEAVGSRLSVTDEQLLVNITNHGNTSAASVPLCLDEFKHKFKKGDKILITAFGAGFTWSAMLLVWA